MCNGGNGKYSNNKVDVDREWTGACRDGFSVVLWLLNGPSTAKVIRANTHSVWM